MASKTKICNEALTRLKAERIQSIDDDTQEARDLKAIYDLAAEAAMSEGPWPSTIARASLAQLEDAPEWGYSYQYQLPTDPKCLRVEEVNECKRGEIDWTIEGDRLLTDESTVGIKYISFVTDTEKYDTYLRQAIVDFLVAELTYAITGQLRLYTDALEYAQKRAHTLLSKAGMQGSSREINSDTFIDARRGSIR